MFEFLRSKPAKILTIFFVVQAAAFYGMSRTEEVRTVNPLKTFPTEFASWTMVNEGTVEKEVMDILKADEVITRTYGDRTANQIAHLFVAYFNTQRTGKAPHSPKNCLPGAGWLPIVNDRIDIDIPGREPVQANRYIVARGDSRSLVLYWYQTHRRTIASEYSAKVYTVVDALRYNRSDTAVVKVTIPIREDVDNEKATQIASEFVRAFFDKLLPYFPA
ncbi:MAG: EpsI family protein [Bryobacterales bacterium]|nr:EpsI family protein [Bryobacterales bacterium]